MAVLRQWAQNRGLNPSETDYIARARDRRELRFSASADAAIERAYRTHGVSSDLSRDAVKRQSTQLHRERAKTPALHQLEAMGYHVTLDRAN